MEASKIALAEMPRFVVLVWVAVMAFSPAVYALINAYVRALVNSHLASACGIRHHAYMAPPRIDPNSHSIIRLAFRVTPELQRQFDVYCYENNVSMSDVLRALIEREMKGTVKRVAGRA